MENASKALIIAGAILISILIIGLGVYFYNMAASAGRKVNLDSQAANAHNQAFTNYFGSRQSATDVKNLMAEVRSNNISGATAEETSQIYVVFKGGTITTAAITSPAKVSSTVKAGKTYWIGVLNDSAATTAQETAGAQATTEPAYYNTGYLRIITINEGGEPSNLGTTAAAGGGE